MSSKMLLKKKSHFSGTVDQFHLKMLPIKNKKVDKCRYVCEIMIALLVFEIQYNMGFFFFFFFFFCNTLYMHQISKRQNICLLQIKTAKLQSSSEYEICTVAYKLEGNNNCTTLFQSKTC